MNDTQLSIIIPVYNVDSYINECLESIKNQTFKEWECILVDDGSTDFSGSICDSYSKNDNRFKVIHQENKGVSAARNAGLNVAEAPLLSFIDPDDFLSNDFYMHLISSMKKEDAQYAAAYYCIVNECGKEAGYNFNNSLRYEWNSKHHPVFKNKTEIINGLDNPLLTAGCWGCVFDKEIWGNEKFPERINFAEDLSIIPYIVTKANKAVYVCEAVYYYRVHGKSLCHTQLNEEKIKNSFKASEMMYQNCAVFDNISNLYFSKLHCLSDIMMYWNYIKNQSDMKDKSKLYYFFELLQEAHSTETDERTKIDERKTTPFC